jgi:hypothetical protein
MGTGLAEAQVSGLSDDEFDALMEVYEVLRLTPENGSPHTSRGNMHTWLHKGLAVVYFILEEQREVAVIRVSRWAA